MNARRDFVIQEDCKRILACLSVKGVTTRAVAPVVKSLLLNAPYFYNGVHIDPKARSLGAGVWELWNGEDARRERHEDS